MTTKLLIVIKLQKLPQNPVGGCQGHEDPAGLLNPAT